MIRRIVFQRCAALLIIALGSPRQGASFSSSQNVSRRRERPLVLHPTTALHSSFMKDHTQDALKSRRRFLSQCTFVAGGAATALVSSSTTTTTTCVAHAITTADTKQPTSTPSPTPSSQMPKQNKKIGGLALKIRAVARVMDELQRDLMQERWDLVGAYPAQLRSFVPIFTTYTDSAFSTDAPTDKGLRVALRYEVGRMFAALERFRQATQRQSLDEAYLAYSEMSLHFDRYLRVGGLYTYYDDMISTEPYFKGFSDDTLVFANPNKDPALVRDLIILIKGPDKGKTGIVIGMYDDGSNRSVIKLDRYKGLREIRVVSNSWVAKRLGEQDPDDVFLIKRKTNGVGSSSSSSSMKPN